MEWALDSLMEGHSRQVKELGQGSMKEAFVVSLCYSWSTGSLWGCAYSHLPDAFAHVPHWELDNSLVALQTARPISAPKTYSFCLLSSPYFSSEKSLPRLNNKAFPLHIIVLRNYNISWSIQERRKEKRESKYVLYFFFPLASFKYPLKQRSTKVSMFGMG